MVVSQVLLADPVTPLTIWAILLVLSLPALMLLGSPEAMRHPIAALNTAGVIRRCRENRARRQETATEAVRFADEIQAAATRAHEAAERWQAHRRASEQHADAAWQKWQNAERQLLRTRSAAAYAAPDNRGTPREYADRERFLHRSVRTAVQNGDLPAAALPAALAGHDGWDPRLHPVEQELVLFRAVAAHRHRLHQRAVSAEQTARHDARLALATRDSLRDEAATATARAASHRRHLPAREHRVSPVPHRSWSHQLA